MGVVIGWTTWVFWHTIYYCNFFEILQLRVGTFWIFKVDENLIEMKMRYSQIGKRWHFSFISATTSPYWLIHTWIFAACAPRFEFVTQISGADRILVWCESFKFGDPWFRNRSGWFCNWRSLDSTTFVSCDIVFCSGGEGKLRIAMAAEGRRRWGTVMWQLITSSRSHTTSHPLRLSREFDHV